MIIDSKVEMICFSCDADKSNFANVLPFQGINNIEFILHL